MTAICLYFQVHQPIRLRDYGVFDIGKESDYFDEEKNKQVMKKVAKKCYLPANEALLKQIKKHDGDFKVAFSITGTAMEQFKEYAPEVLESFKELAETGHVEFLAETYYHSLSFLYSKEEFESQVRKHEEMIKEHFGQEPEIFRYTELIYNNDVAKYAEEMGYKGVLAEGADHILGWRSPNFVYKPVNADIKLLLKNYQLSDDIAFRFSNEGWEEHPLTLGKYSAWLDSCEGETVNLFMDYETFGEHHWEDTGILEFLEGFSDAVLERGLEFKTPSELLEVEPEGELDIPFYTSWADVERDLSAWKGNAIQESALNQLYELEEKIKETGDEDLIEDWKRLTTSDHFYYMCVKWFDDGDVHKYFNPYDTPYEAYITFMNVLNDIMHRLKEIAPEAIEEEPSIELTEQPSSAV